MICRIITTPQANRQFKRLDRQFQDRVRRAIEALADNPRPMVASSSPGWKAGIESALATIGSSTTFRTGSSWSSSFASVTAARSTGDELPRLRPFDKLRAGKFKASGQVCGQAVVCLFWSVIWRLLSIFSGPSSVVSRLPCVAL